MFPVAMVSVMANLVILSSPRTYLRVSLLRRKLEANIELVILRSSVQWQMNFGKRVRSGRGYWRERRWTNGVNHIIAFDGIGNLDGAAVAG